MRTIWALPIGLILLTFGSIAGSPKPSLAVRAPERAAQATTPATDPPISSSRSVNLNEEQRYIIRENVLKDTAQRREPEGRKVTIGDMMPSGVVTYEFTSDVTSRIPSLKAYNYFVVGEQIVLVDPKDGRVADIVKSQ